MRIWVAMAVGVGLLGCASSSTLIGEPVIRCGQLYTRDGTTNLYDSIDDVLDSLDDTRQVQEGHCRPVFASDPAIRERLALAGPERVCVEGVRRKACDPWVTCRASCSSEAIEVRKVSTAPH